MEVGCTRDSDCPSQHACIHGKCRNPCQLSKPCGIQAECAVLDTLPVRTLTCTCLPGYEGDASVECTPIKSCPPNRNLILNEHDKCVCPPFHAFDENDVCIPCPSDKGFIINNLGYCVCDSARGLIFDARSKTCVCPPGYFQNTEGICEEEPECRVDPHCSTIKYCELSNGTCADPCIRDPCGAFAHGVPFNHRCHCECIHGYTGNPKIECGKIFFYFRQEETM